MTAIEKWNTRYREDDEDPAPPLPFFVDWVTDLKPGRALDLACGTGRHSIWLAERGWQVTAIDGSEVAIRKLSERTPVVNTLLADIEASDFRIPGCDYDLIVDTFFLHVPLFPQVYGALRPGAMAVFAFHLAGTFGIKDHDLDELKRDYEVLHEVKHDQLPTVELVLRKPSI